MKTGFISIQASEPTGTLSSPQRRLHNWWKPDAYHKMLNLLVSILQLCSHFACWTLISQASCIFFIFGGLGLAAKIKGVAWQLSDSYMDWESTYTSSTSSWWSHGECEILLLIAFGLLSLTDLTTYSQCFDSSVHLHSHSSAPLPQLS